MHMWILQAVYTVATCWSEQCVTHWMYGLHRCAWLLVYWCFWAKQTSFGGEHEELIQTTMPFLLIKSQKYLLPFFRPILVCYLCWNINWMTSCLFCLPLQQLFHLFASTMAVFVDCPYWVFSLTFCLKNEKENLHSKCKISPIFSFISWRKAT